MSVHAIAYRNADLLQMNPRQLKGALETLANEVSLRAFDKVSEILPIEKIQEAVRIDCPEHLDVLHSAKAMFQEAKCYILETESKISSTLKAKLTSLIEAIVSALESILNSFGIASLFKPAESEIHADMKGQKIMLLLSLFSLLSTALIPVAGAAVVGTIVGAALLAIAALSLIFPLIKPPSAEIPNGVNWTKKFQLGLLDVVGGRKQAVDEIAEVLKTSKQTKTHPMLIGKSGVGKTETVKAFVQAVERGEYPELKGKKIIYFNTADLVNHTEIFNNGNRILKQIQETIGRHKEQYVLVFDEIHLACQKKEHSAIADQLKILLDGAIPFAIGITTEEDYFRDIYVNHAAFARRFKRIDIDNTQPEETLAILQKAFLKQAPKMLMEAGALQTLLDKTIAAFPQTAPQPATALKILSKCIQKTTDAQKSPLELRVEKMRERIQDQYVRKVIGGEAAPHHTEEELVQLEKQLRQETEEFVQFYQLRDTLAVAKQKMFHEAIKVAHMKARTKEAKEFLLLRHFLIPALESRIRKEGDRLGIKTTLNPALIDRAILEEQEMDRRVQQAIEQGRVQIQQRAG